MHIKPIRSGSAHSGIRGLLPAVGVLLAASVVLTAGGCGEPEPEPRTGIPVEAPTLRASDGLLESPELMRVMDLGIERDGEALRELLGHEDGAVRARAAFAIASVVHLDAIPDLTALLDDEEPAVRRDAAFALGQMRLPDEGASMVDALVREEDPEVRASLLEALGRTGSAEVLGRLLELNPDTGAAAWTRALARATVRNVYPDGIMEAMADRLGHPDPQVRELAAASFGRGADTARWSELGDRVRAALDGYLPGEPAAMHLTLALARQGHRADMDRLLGWLEEAEDWRVRASVARGLGATVWLDASAVRDALIRALGDESLHVGVSAARSLLQGLWVPPDVHRAAEAWIDGAPRWWQTHVPFLRELAMHRDPDQVLEWTRRMLGVNPVAVARGLAALHDIPGEDINRFVIELTEHPDPVIRAAAVGAMTQRWPTEAFDREGMERMYELFVRQLGDGPPAAVLNAASVLAHPGFFELGAPEALAEAYERRKDTGNIPLLAGLLDALALIGTPPSMALVEEALEDEDYRIRRAAARALEAHEGRGIPGEVVATPDPERTVDWERLAALGPEPRLRIETDQGEMVVRLVPEQAPLTVHTLAEQAEAGLHDGTWFHRIEPNFVIQAGDVSVGDGRGGPGYRIRTELTHLPFRRGVAGMASAGKDTEGSQYYLLHSTHLHLDGGYTAFGWVESGWDVLDRIVDGHRVVRMSVEPTPEE